MTPPTFSLSSVSEVSISAALPSPQTRASYPPPSRTAPGRSCPAPPAASQSTCSQEERIEARMRLRQGMEGGRDGDDDSRMHSNLWVFVPRQAGLFYVTEIWLTNFTDESLKIRLLPSNTKPMSSATCFTFLLLPYFTTIPPHQPSHYTPHSLFVCDMHSRNQIHLNKKQVPR